LIHVKPLPGFRFLEKEAVRIGGGMNHRMGLYDMILLKDNHIDYAGGIDKAINKTSEYLKKNNLNLKVEIEARSLEDVRTILSSAECRSHNARQFQYQGYPCGSKRNFRQV
jgi:nicotinate-nucleotide pyrophosphorylase (carboxylating)